MAYDHSVQRHIERCGNCSSDDVRLCTISRRPYCGSCSHWAPVNYGSTADAITRWNSWSVRQHEKQDEEVALFALRRHLARIKSPLSSVDVLQQLNAMLEGIADK